MITCIHVAPGKTGLCPQCSADYDEDPSAWLEFGDYPDGIANQKALRAEMDAAAEQARQRDYSPVDDSEFPF